MQRRDFIKTAAVALATTGLSAVPGATDLPASEPKEPFRLRGYYTIGTRYPTAGLGVWKSILDAMHADGCNLLVHWIAGGFKSKKYPDTWAHNADHANVKADFTREMIDYAHTKGIRVLLGFTPFGYDGVNLHARKHPDLIATGEDGKPTGEFGIGCWGQSLCPAKAGSQEFMLEYVREMIFDFYPNADGLFIESSDYSTCRCEACGKNGGSGHFDREFAFVRKISDEVWKASPKATVVVYPHYFGGGEAEFLGSKRKTANQPFDPRWTVFFTPHSTRIDPALMKKAKDSIWWDEAMLFGTPESVRAGARKARDAGFTGYVPTLEAYSFLATHVEGEPWTKGRRQVPFGIGWVPDDRSAYDELPIRAVRIAYREFTKAPDLSFADFRTLLGKEVFGEKATAKHVDDLLMLQQYVRHERDWALPSPVVEPLRVKWFAESGQLKDERKADLRKAVENMRGMAVRYAGRAGAEGELGRAAKWIAERWAGENGKLLGLKDAP